MTLGHNYAVHGEVKEWTRPRDRPIGHPFITPKQHNSKYRNQWL